MLTLPPFLFFNTLCNQTAKISKLHCSVLMKVMAKKQAWVINWVKQKKKKSFLYDLQMKTNSLQLLLWMFVSS